MEAGIPISSIGVKISYAIETTADTRPTTGYTHIPDLKEFPDTDSAPDTAETTTLDNTEFKTYMDLLKDLGGAQTITANYTKKLVTAWRKLYLDHTAAIKDGKRTWFCIDIPDYPDEAWYFTGNPSNIGMPAISTNALIEKNVYITITGEPIYEQKPTYITA